ncbi:MAG: FAD-dependent oxidoreductase, partial [Duodenibacillus sp.]|nr:FAD-dependent oxidoreductase [Duodenibacillus sp.]
MAACAAAAPARAQEAGRRCDVVVAGAGGAGLTAAALLGAAPGLSVSVFEACPLVGGSTVMCGGQWAVCGTELQRVSGVADGPELFAADMMRVGKGAARPGLVAAMVEASARQYAWTLARGVSPRTLAVSAGMSVPRAHIFSPHDIVDMLLGEALRRGVSIEASSRVTALLQDEAGAVRGVRVLQGGRELTVRCRAVLLATGGFARDKALLSEFSPGMEHVIAFAGPGSRGDGLRMARSAGAALADTGNIRPSFGFSRGAGGTTQMTGVFYSGAVIVNAGGRRFVDESLPNKEIGERAMREPAAYLVFDEAMRARQMRIRPNDAILLRDVGGRQATLQSGSSFAELAKIANIPAQALEETLSQYNRAVREGLPDAMGRKSLSAGWGRLAPVEKPPFYIMQAFSGILGTNGGVSVSPRAEVLRPDGSPVPGLYAAGEVTGGVHGDGFMAGTGLAKAFAFGRLAAEAIAAGCSA